MAADETGNTLENAINSERFIRFAPNLVPGIYSSPERDLPSRKPEIRNPGWPPAAILNFTKTLITFEPFVRFSPNSTWSFILMLPRLRNGKNVIFQNAKWPQLKFWAADISRFMPFSTLQFIPIEKITYVPTRRSA
jgi:hypothetical protein